MLDRLAGAPSARPCPLKIVAAEPARDVHCLADCIEPGYRARRHGLRRKSTRIDSAYGHFRLAPSFRFGRPHFEAAQTVDDREQASIGQVRYRLSWCDALSNRLRKAGRHDLR